MVDAGGGEQNGLPFRAEFFCLAGKQKPAHGLRSRRPAGFARDQNADAGRFQAFGQKLDLRGLAGALAAFERDKPPCQVS